MSKNKQKIDQELFNQIKELKRRSTNPRNYVLFERIFSFAFPKVRHDLFIQEIINVGEMTVNIYDKVLKNGQRSNWELDKNGLWFKCTSRRLQNLSPHWTPKTQEAYFRYFKSIGILETRRKKARLGVRYIKINFGILNKILDKVELKIQNKKLRDLDKEDDLFIR